MLVDTRAGSKELIAPLLARGVDVEPAMLAYGDISFLGNSPRGAIGIGIEHKTVTDILACLQSKRFVGHQLPGMLEEYGRSYLVIEGVFRANPRDGILEVPYRGGSGWMRWGSGKQRRWARPMMYRDFLGFLTSIEEAGVRVRRTITREDTIEALISLYRWWSKKWDKHASLSAIYDGDRISERDEVLQVRRAGLARTIAAQLPGIGWKKSARVVGVMPTVFDMATADVAEWRSVPGIGVTLSKRIHRAMREKEKR